MILGISGRIGSGKDTVGEIIQYLTEESDKFCEFREWQRRLISRRESKALPKFKWEVKKFAAKLKQIASIMTGVSQNKFENQEFKAQLMPQEWWYWKLSWTSGDDGPGFITFHTKEEAIKYIEENYEDAPEDVLSEIPCPLEYIKPTYREFLQKLGTEVGREIHSDVWVNALFTDYYEPALGTLTINPNTWDEHKVEQTGSYPNWIITDPRFENEAKAIKDRKGFIIRLQRNSDSTDTHPSETSLDNYRFDYTIQNDGTIEELIEAVKLILIDLKIL